MRPGGNLVDIDTGKKERLLKTAAKVFGKKGYHATRISEVASEAGVSPKTLYKYFDSKRDLFIETRQWASGQLRADIISHYGSIKAQLKLSERAYVCAGCGYTEDRELNAAINLSLLAGSSP